MADKKILDNIKKLREITGVGFSDCKAAITETNGDLEKSIENQKIILLDLDVNGTMAIKKLYPNASLSIFIVPPSIATLRHRLMNRGTETQISIDKRLERFNKEMKYKDRFDTLLINDNIDVAINNFILIIDKMIKGDI